MTESLPPASGDTPMIAVPTVALLSGDPTAEELAALIAVVSESYEREAAATLAEDSSTASAWNVSARGLRSPLPRGIAWGRFAG